MRYLTLVLLLAASCGGGGSAPGTWRSYTVPGTFGVTALWASAPDDVWAANGQNLFHFDGGSFQKLTDAPIVSANGLTNALAEFFPDVTEALVGPLSSGGVLLKSLISADANDVACASFAMTDRRTRGRTRVVKVNRVRVMRGLFSYLSCAAVQCF